MKIVNNIILKHLAVSYVLYTRDTSNETLSFENYCDSYNYILKNYGNVVADVVSSANQQIKKEKKEKKKK